MAELFDHNDLLVGGDGDDIDPIDGVDDKKVVLLSGSGRAFDFGADLEDTKIADGRRFDFGPWFNHRLPSFRFGCPSLFHEGEQMG